MTPSLTVSDLETFITDSGWSPDNRKNDRDRKDLSGENHTSVLVFAEENCVYALDIDGHVRKLAERERWISSIESKGSHIYDACEDYNIYETLSSRIIGTRRLKIRTLCSYKNELLDAGDYQDIISTKSQETYYGWNGNVFSLTSHDRGLFGACKEGLFDLTNKQEVRDRHKSFEGLCALVSFEESLICGMDDGRMFEIGGCTPLGKRDYEINDFCVHEGTLYDAGCSRIVHTLTKKVVIQRENTITAVCTHPRRYLVEEGILPP